MNLCIDQGNSSTKVGIFDDNKLHCFFVFEVFDVVELLKLLEEFPIDNCIVSSVVNESDTLIKYLKDSALFVVFLSHTTPIPIENRYETPETLGKDRLAAVVGAAFLMPNQDVLVIDAGTAITYDFIDAQHIYWGGNISPGVNLRLKSLHEFTKKLPLVEITMESTLLGKNTKSAIISGAINGIIFEMDGYIFSLKNKYPQLSTFLTGGSTFYFYTKLKNTIFAEKNLVLIGLNRILHYNVQK